MGIADAVARAADGNIEVVVDWKSDVAPTAWGMNVAKRRGMARARVAVARNLEVILHRMWADGNEFRWGRQAAA